MDVKVLTIDPNTGSLKLGLSRPPQKVVGIDKLVQIVALLFLNNGNRSIFNPGRAGGFRQLIGSNVDPEDPSELYADVRLIVNRIEAQVKEDQAITTRPPSERLQSLLLVDVRPSGDGTEVEVIVAIVNEEQQQAQAVVAIP